MATGNLKARIERLESKTGGAEPLIVRLHRHSEPPDGFNGVMTNGTFTPCAEGQTAAELEEWTIADIKRRRQAGVFVVKQTRQLVIAQAELSVNEWAQRHCTGKSE
ncbi:hypothetical protein [Burkholderia multivorans]|uniref:hypothetical protein n=1 Tax=Burkholderia multivorans TaxID=87883 RepID=UPI0021C0AF6B|nr:hypothetical protein [Burkholderia multivorans]